MPDIVWDNCCECVEAPTGSAYMEAYYVWPGWAPFTGGFSFDTIGFRYRTLTVATYWYNIISNAVVPFQVTITSDQLNGAFANDPLTGTAPAIDINEPGWILGGIANIADPNLVVTQTQLKLPGDGAIPDITLTLSDPVTLKWCKDAAYNLLLLAGGVDALHEGQQKQARWKVCDDSRMPNTLGYIQPATADMTNNPDINAVVMCWQIIDGQQFGGQLITTRDHIGPGGPSGYLEPYPFAYCARQVVLLDVVTSYACQRYTQELFWSISEVRYYHVNQPMCRTDSFTDGFLNNFQPDQCSMVQPAPDGTVKLTAPDLAPDVTTNTKNACSFAVAGQVLTDGGCPCKNP